MFDLLYCDIFEKVLTFSFLPLINGSSTLKASQRYTLTDIADRSKQIN